MANSLKDVIKEARDLLDDAIAAENEKPPNASGSQQAAQGAIDGRVNQIIILTSPPNLNPSDAGQTFAAIFHDSRLPLLQLLRDHANNAYNEAENSNNQDVIGEHLWTIWNSRFGLYALYP